MSERIEDEISEISFGSVASFNLLFKSDSLFVIILADSASVGGRESKLKSVKSFEGEGFCF